MTVAKFSRDDILRYCALEEGKILGTIKTLKNLGYSDSQIVEYLIDKCNIDKEKAEKYVLDNEME